MAQRLVATRSLLELSDRDATAVSCWHLVATVRDSWLVMAATLRECWRWHLRNLEVLISLPTSLLPDREGYLEGHRIGQWASGCH